MAKKSPVTLPVKKFFGKYAKAIENGPAEEARRLYPNVVALLEAFGEEYKPTRDVGLPWFDIQQHWRVRLLRQAAEEGDAEGCKRLLHYFLLEPHIRLPEGVLIPFRWKRGRPNEAEKIYEAWDAKGRPSATWRVCDDLAREFYPEEFAQAKSNANLRKRLRDRVRATVLRHELLLGATKSAPIS